MAIANCRKCGKVFHRAGGDDCCEFCSKDVTSQVSYLYNFLHENPDLTMEEVAARCDIPIHELKALFYKGKLGTAAGNIDLKCHRCGVSLKKLGIIGRFCLNCTDQIRTEAGLPVTDEEKKEKLKKDTMEDLKDKHLHRRPGTQEPVVSKEEDKKQTPPRRSRDDDGGTYGFKRFSN